MLGNKHETAEQVTATRSLDIRLLTDPCVLACYERLHIVPLHYYQAERIRDRLPTREELAW